MESTPCERNSYIEMSPVLVLSRIDFDRIQRRHLLFNISEGIESSIRRTSKCIEVGRQFWVCDCSSPSREQIQGLFLYDIEI